MSMSTYYRAQAQRCLALSRACSDRRHEAQLTFMANRYFERAGELEQETCPGAHPPSATQVRSQHEHPSFASPLQSAHSNELDKAFEAWVHTKNSPQTRALLPIGFA